MKTIKLRYDAVCSSCATGVPAGTRAAYYPATKTVDCLGCASEPIPAAPPAAAASSPLVVGSAGSSAEREFARRSAKEEKGRKQGSRLLRLVPLLGLAVFIGVFTSSTTLGLVMAGLFTLTIFAAPTLSQNTQAWHKGALGEQAIAAVLDPLVTQGVSVLHDRRVPGSKANLDHLAVGPSGVYVIDAKRYSGRLEIRRGSQMWINGRNKTDLVEKARWQASVVEKALDKAGYPGLTVTPVLAFVGTEMPFQARTLDGVHLVSRKALRSLVTSAGYWTPGHSAAVAAVLARELKPA